MSTPRPDPTSSSTIPLSQNHDPPSSQPPPYISSVINNPTSQPSHDWTVPGWTSSINSISSLSPSSSLATLDTTSFQTPQTPLTPIMVETRASNRSDAVPYPSDMDKTTSDITPTIIQSSQAAEITAATPTRGRGSGRGRGSRGGRGASVGRGRGGRGRGRGTGLLVNSNTTNGTGTPPLPKISLKRGRKRKLDSDDENIKATDTDSESDSTEKVAEPISTTTKSGRQINKPASFKPPPPTTTRTGQNGVTHKKRKISKKEANVLCAYCLRGQSQHGNKIVFCDRCNLAWHQRCQVPLIPESVLEVEEAPWYCSDCTASKESKAKAKKQAKINADLADVVSTNPATVPQQLQQSEAQTFPDEAKTRAYLLSLRKETLIDLLIKAHAKHPDIVIRVSESVDNEFNLLFNNKDSEEADDDGDLPPTLSGCGVQLPPLAEDMYMMLEGNDGPGGAFSHRVYEDGTGVEKKLVPKQWKPAAKKATAVSSPTAKKQKKAKAMESDFEKAGVEAGGVTASKPTSTRYRSPSLPAKPTPTVTFAPDTVGGLSSSSPLVERDGSATQTS